MCTAMSWKGLFGRTLDLERSYGETVTVTPRRFSMETGEEGYALIGMAHVEDGFPLYYDAVNEMGLGMAGLNFPGYARYRPAAEGRENVPSFALIPWVLRRCASVGEARLLVERVTVTDTPFRAELPPTPLHWMIADREESIVVEQTAEGLRVYDDPVGVLTNSPPFPVQMLRLGDYAGLRNEAPTGLFAGAVEVPLYSRGMGSMSLPGDWSSTSRFVRASFAALSSAADEGERVGQFFHLMDTVGVPRGCVKLADGSFVTTRYTSCCDLKRAIYYYTTYESRAIHAVSLHREDLSGSRLRSWPLPGRERVRRQN